MGIQLTEIAADRVQNFLTNRGKGIGLRPWCKNNGLFRAGICTRIRR